MERANKDGRPVVVLYYADSDPSGHQMAVSVARKIQAHLDFQYPNLDVKLYRVALTIDQVRAWGLPDKPIPPKEKRAAAWRQRFGVEQTEIDAAIELAPDQLRAAIFEATAPFYDDTLDQRVEEAEEDWQQEADETLRNHHDYQDCQDRIKEALARLRVEASDLKNEQERAVEILKSAVPPPPDLPEPAPSGTPKPALFDSRTDFVTASLQLIADKKLSAVDEDGPEEDSETEEPDPEDDPL